MVILFALRFNTRGHVTQALAGVKEWFAWCQTCDTVTAAPAPPAPDFVASCDVCHPELVPCSTT